MPSDVLGAIGSWQHGQTLEAVSWPSMMVGVWCTVFFELALSIGVMDSWPKRDSKVSES